MRSLVKNLFYINFINFYSMNNFSEIACIFSIINENKKLKTLQDAYKDFIKLFSRTFNCSMNTKSPPYIVVLNA